MTNEHARPSEPRDAEMEARVAEYLQSHTDFFERHPDTLAALHLHHDTEGAISLIEHQVRVLRRELGAERQRLTHLIARARDYDAQLSRMHALVLQLIVIEDPAHLCDLLKDALAREFRADAVALRLFRVPDDIQDENDTLTAAFGDFLDREHALCGALDERRAELLFGAEGKELRTAALVPIRTDQRSGVLAIGSRDPERFAPDLGTEVLDRLGEIISHKLRVVALDQCNSFED